MMVAWTSETAMSKPKGNNTIEKLVVAAAMSFLVGIMFGSIAVMALSGALLVAAAAVSSLSVVGQVRHQSHWRKQW
jgi:cell division septal protein FtsQ